VTVAIVRHRNTLTYNVESCCLAIGNDQTLSHHKPSSSVGQMFDHTYTHGFMAPFSENLSGTTYDFWILPELSDVVGTQSFSTLTGKR